MANEGEDTQQLSPEMEQMAAQKARDRATSARWDLNVLIFLFAILILVIILATYTKVGLEIVAPIAFLGLAMVWLVGLRQGKQLHRRFYDEELSKLEYELRRMVKEEETVEERVQRALRERWK